MKPKILLPLLLCLAALVRPGTVAAQAASADPAAQAALFERAVRDEMKEKSAVGAAVAVVRDGRVVFAKGFGAASAETQAPVTTATLFQVGSVTKPFTAALILKMAEEGALRLDAPVGEYAKNLNPKLAALTFAQLLSHTAGVADEPDEFGAADESLMGPYLRSWGDEYALFAPGRQIFSYSNSGFALAGFAAQEAAGKNFADLLGEKIFAPLGMTSATFRPTVAMTYPLAVGHAAGRDGRTAVVRPLPQDARLYPAGTFYVSLDDLTRFARAFLGGGKIDGRAALSPGAIERMKTPRAFQPSAADDTAYGLGLFTNSEGGLRRCWHDGSMTGYAASMYFVPEKNFAVLILGNTNNVVLEKTRAAALEIYLGVKSAPAPAPAAEMPLAADEIARIAGAYEQPKRFRIEIFARDGRAFIREFGREMPLAKIGADRYRFQFPGAPRPVEIVVRPSAEGAPGFVHQYVWAFRKIN